MRNNNKRLAQPEIAPEPPSPPQQVVVQPHTVFPYSPPTELVELPSRGVFYPEDHPLHKKKKAEIKLMTAQEEDILSSESLVEEGVAVTKMLESIIVDKNIDIDSLLACDRDALLVAARISGYGAPYQAKVSCTQCFETTDYAFDLTKKNINFKLGNKKVLAKHKLKFDDENQTLVCSLPASKIEVEIRPITNFENVFNASNFENKMITEYLSSLIVKAAGFDDPSVIKSFVYTMPASDSKLLRQIALDYLPSYDINQEFVCSHCGHKEIREVPLNAGFFWPE
tara:strand:+ start:137 stop:985 length:849 start_codon:yes stop_codon:yes gene_type:complete